MCERKRVTQYLHVRSVRTLPLLLLVMLILSLILDAVVHVCRVVHGRACGEKAVQRAQHLMQAAHTHGRQSHAGARALRGAAGAWRAQRVRHMAEHLREPTQIQIPCEQTAFT
jgi:hypothetical protein